MAFLGDGFAAMLESRKKFVDSTNEVQGEAVAGTGDGTGRGLDSSLGSVQTFTKKSPTGYCGLANQGATCYLNSLLQSMYMLPGFRAAVYGWRFDEAQHGEDARNVARQLQRLFTQLQLSERCAVTTAALTKSFGWTAGQQFQQQDVQECKAVIIDHLSTHCAGSSLGDHMASCHTGTTSRILRCSGCGGERAREEAFRDLQLEVKDNSTGSPMDPSSQSGLGSLEAALAAYMAPETIEGLKGPCGQEHAHEKMLHFGQLPCYLPLVLKRFSINWSTGARIKLSDWLSVPQVIDLAPFVAPRAVDGDAAAGGVELKQEEGGSTTYRLSSVLMHTGGAYGGHYFAYLRDEGAEEVGEGEKESGTWLKFNDATVTRLTEEEVARTFRLCAEEEGAGEEEAGGGQRGDPDEDHPAVGASAPVLESAPAVIAPAPAAAATAEPAELAEEHRKSAAAAIQARWKRRRGGAVRAAPAVGEHAYMLIYTRSRPAPVQVAAACGPPPDLAAEVAADNARFAQLRAEWEEEQRYLRFTLEVGAAEAGNTRTLRLLKTATLHELTEMALDAEQEEEEEQGEVGATTAMARPALDDVRLRAVHKATGLLLEPLCSGGDGTVDMSTVGFAPVPGASCTSATMPCHFDRWHILRPSVRRPRSPHSWLEVSRRDRDRLSCD
jgi:ubiquitin C-terminal hydrolase